jgi:hypothetical protein
MVRKQFGKKKREKMENKAYQSSFRGLNATGGVDKGVGDMPTELSAPALKVPQERDRFLKMLDGLDLVDE